MEAAALAATRTSSGSSASSQAMLSAGMPDLLPGPSELLSVGVCMSQPRALESPQTLRSTRRSLGRKQGARAALAWPDALRERRAACAAWPRISNGRSLAAGGPCASQRGGLRLWLCAQPRDGCWGLNRESLACSGSAGADYSPSDDLAELMERYTVTCRPEYFVKLRKKCVCAAGWWHLAWLA